MKSRMDPEAINTDVVSHEDNADSRTDSAAPTRGGKRPYMSAFLRGRVDLARGTYAER